MACTSHIPVLLNEVIEYLNPKDGERYLDVTFGAGGYTKKILESANCKVVAIDQDPSVMGFAEILKRDYHSRFEFINNNFGSINSVLQDQKFDGIIADLGVSSMQLDQAERGFSFMQDGPLDMRMSGSGFSASDFINNAKEEEIANVIFKYGEETASRKIARAIVHFRSINPINTTATLANIVRKAIGFRSAKIDTATKTFQAIRIYVNKELENLEFLLENSKKLLAARGRMIIVSFHSLEDSVVKAFFNEHSPKREARSKYSKFESERDPKKWLSVLTKKPVTPSIEEVRHNPRSRSAKLRAAVGVECL